MIYVDTEKCAGCGFCADACPVGAISLTRGTAQVDQEKCTDCEACVEVCPNRAMFAVREPVAERVTVPSVRPAREAIRVRPQPAPVSLPTRALPAVSAAAAALTYLGRNIAPRLADYLLNALDRRLSQGQTSPAVGTSGGVSPASGVGGRRSSTGLRRAQLSRSGRGSGRGLRRRRRRGRGRR
jgi:NAD-dependent dihydropyrimidine dehydrogenase PreA subunit